MLGFKLFKNIIVIRILYIGFCFVGGELILICFKWYEDGCKSLMYK